VIVKQVDERTRSKTSVNELLRGARRVSVPILYGLDNCDTCRKARNWLKRAGVEHEFVDYRERRIEPATLKAWAQQLGGWDKLVNKASTTWRNLPEGRKTPGPIRSGRCSSRNIRRS
jgi:glutaredoxin